MKHLFPTIFLTLFLFVTSALFIPAAASGGNPVICQTPKLEPGINTAIGCIPMITQTVFLNFIILWSIGVSGGIGLILLGYASFLIIVDLRDPRRKSLGREMFWSTLMGILLLITSVYLLNAIGIGILGLIQVGT